MFIPLASCVKDTGLLSFARQRKLEMSTCSSAEIAKAAFELFLANYCWEKPVHSIGMRGAEPPAKLQVVVLSVTQSKYKAISSIYGWKKPLVLNPFIGRISVDMSRFALIRRAKRISFDHKVTSLTLKTAILTGS